MHAWHVLVDATCSHLVVVLNCEWRIGAFGALQARTQCEDENTESGGIYCGVEFFLLLVLYCGVLVAQ